MLENLKNKVSSIDKEKVKNFAVNVASGIALGVAIKVGTFIVVEGTKALIEEVNEQIAAKKEG